MVVGNLCQVIKFEVINKHGKPFFKMLPDDMLNNEIRFTATWRAQDQEGTRPSRRKNDY
jgi:hypothetical protein